MREKRESQQNHGYQASQLNSDKASFLARSAIFQHLQLEDIHEVERIMSSFSCLSRRILYRPGEACNALYLLASGQIQIYHLSTDGRKLITDIILPGGNFGALPTTETTTYTSFAEAVSESQLYVINKVDLDHLLMDKPAISYALLQVMGQRLVFLEKQLTDVAFKSVTARLASLLLQLAQPQTQQHELVVKGLSHEELADRLGVYRETVSTTLRELKEAGTITIRRKHITISQPEILQQLARAGGKTGIHVRVS